MNNLIKLKEEVRVEMVKNNLEVLDMLANGHNLIGCIENKQWERLPKLTRGFVNSYNSVIEELNKDKYEVIFSNTSSTSPIYCNKCNPETFKEYPEIAKQCPITKRTECSICRNVIYEKQTK